ncbi:predicted protein [Uncinocarpus reesii 1704]|uniref:NADP-dependent oxidoreductase domain-containing protein n=1 Tax=Uncinocarpus reesii (strain UAMH 1704) TaxID=336963 RepID=C4JIT8_UNCRE|nr:uncharacterized protein UREG_02949 [Uncinocarpus reesii 1704]EEP78100.1 predicted protein [Uncinocarpus reesii 1704]
MPTVAGKPVGPVGFGLMGFTWTPTPTPYEEAFEVMKSALGAGANLWNGGELYGTPDANSLHLLKAYFTKYPEDADKVVLSIKGCVGPNGCDSSPAGVRRSVENCVRILDGTKGIDIFEAARIDKKVPIEETMRTFCELKDEGKIGGIGLSEVSAATIRRAAAVAPIAAVEVELSLWCTDPMENGILSACTEFGIPLVAYSPLGRGFLTGQIRTADDLPEGDMRRQYPRFQPGAFEINLRLVDALRQVSQRKKVALSQVAIAWAIAQANESKGSSIIPIPGSRSKGRAVENSTVIELKEEELQEIQAILSKFNVQGERYPSHLMQLSDV